MSEPPGISLATHCRHCQEAIPSDRLAQQNAFCCAGCQSVYTLLHSAGLGDYYRIQAAVPSLRKPQAVPQRAQDYSFLDDPELTPVQTAADGQRCLDFYVEGVHCAACVWLIEKLPDILPDVTSARLQLGEATASIALKPDGSFAKVAAMLQSFGYTPHAIKSKAEAENFRRKENHAQLIRIGVAAFSAGNLMILSVALYSGLTGDLARYFHWLSLVLVLPALTYSAWPFYRSAWANIRQRHMSIDIPIAVSLLIGLFAGIWHVAIGQETYYDSLSTLVFLLLLSRYALARVQQHVVGQSAFLEFYQNAVVHVIEGSQVIDRPLHSLAQGMHLEVRPNERIPVDGIVVQGESAVDQSILSGEAYPVQIAPGSEVWCGTLNQNGTVVVEARQVGEDTRIARILQQTRSNLLSRTRLVSTTDRLSRRFVAIVLTAAVLILILVGQHDMDAAFARALALVIISCPCALALTTPLIMTLSLKKAYRKGYLIKDTSAIERLPQLRTLLFDKTGTLTEGRFEVLSATGFTPRVAAAVAALESYSDHPVARTLVQHLQAEAPFPWPQVADFHARNTGGVQGWIDGQLWAVVPDQADAEQTGAPVTALQVLCDDEPVAHVTLGDRIRPEMKATLAALKVQGYTLGLVSGDQQAACLAVAQEVGIPADKVFWRHTPEQKEARIREFEAPAMIGDGVNDMIALAAADLGISVQGGVEDNLRAADIHLSGGGVRHLPGLLRHAQITMRTIRFSLGFSLCYNLLAITASGLGYVTPLFAAILMPISSLTVLAIALYGGKRL